MPRAHQTSSRPASTGATAHDGGDRDPRRGRSRRHGGLSGTTPGNADAAGRYGSSSSPPASASSRGGFVQAARPSSPSTSGGHLSASAPGRGQRRQRRSPPRRRGPKPDSNRSSRATLSPLRRRNRNAGRRSAKSRSGLPRPRYAFGGDSPHASPTTRSSPRWDDVARGMPAVEAEYARAMDEAPAPLVQAPTHTRSGVMWIEPRHNNTRVSVQFDSANRYVSGAYACCRWCECVCVCVCVCVCY